MGIRHLGQGLLGVGIAEGADDMTGCVAGAGCGAAETELLDDF